MCPTAVSSHELAAALAARLDDLAPEGLRVLADGEQITVRRGASVLGGSAAPGILDEGGDDRQVETAARSTISAVQDVFAEELRSPWPAAAGSMPAPEARVDGGVLRAWFGDADEPVAALAPLALR